MDAGAWARRAVVAVVLAIAVTCAGSLAAPEPATAHHVQYQAKLTKLAKAIRIQQGAARRFSIQARRFERVARLRGMSRMRARSFRPVRLARMRATRASRNVRRLQLQLRRLQRARFGSARGARAEFSTDQWAVRHDAPKDLAHYRINYCDGSTQTRDATRGDADPILGPFRGPVKSIEMQVGNQVRGAAFSGQWNGCPDPRAKKVTVCHATGSATNPFVQIEIARAGLHGHEDHEDDVIIEAGTTCPRGETSPPPPPDCDVRGAFVTLGDFDGVVVRFNEELDAVTVSSQRRVICAVVGMCNGGTLEQGPVALADGRLSWATRSDPITWIDIQIEGVEHARRYETHTKCPYIPEPYVPTTYVPGPPPPPPPIDPTLLEPVSELCRFASNTHAYLYSDGYKSIELRTCDGFAVRMFDDPIIEVTDGYWYSSIEWPIGFGNGQFTLRDGTRVTWDLQDSLWTKTIVIEKPGHAPVAATAFGFTASAPQRGMAIPLTDGQVREIASRFYQCRGAIANPLSCGGPARSFGSISATAPSAPLVQYETASIPATSAFEVASRYGSYGVGRSAYLDYSPDACASSDWAESMRPRSIRQRATWTGGAVSVRPLRAGSAKLCLYAWQHEHATTDWGALVRQVDVQVEASAMPPLELTIQATPHVGVPNAVIVANVPPHTRLRVFEQPADAACDTTGRLVAAGPVAAVTWTPALSGLRRVCAFASTPSATFVGSIDASVAEQSVADFVLEPPAVLVMGRAFSATVRGTAQAPLSVEVGPCAQPSVYWSGTTPVATGAFSTTVEAAGVTAERDVIELCARARSTIDGHLSAWASVTVPVEPAPSGAPSLGIRIDSPPTTLGPIRYAIVDAAGTTPSSARLYAVPGAGRRCDGAADRISAAWDGLSLPVPGRYLLCAAHDGRHGQRAIEVVDSPEAYEPPAVALRTESGAERTSAGTTARVRRFMNANPSVHAYSWRSLARLEVETTTTAEATWVRRSGTRGCASDVDGAASGMRSLDAGSHVLSLGYVDDSAGVTFCVYVREDDGSLLHARVVAFPTLDAYSFLTLDVPGSIPPGSGSSFSLQGRSWDTVTVFAHRDASRPCQTLPFEEAGVGIALAHELWFNGGTFAIPPLDAGTWRICAYSSYDVWHAPTWFDTRAINVGGAWRASSLALQPTPGAPLAGLLEPLATTSAADAADGRVFAAAVPADAGCPTDFTAARTQARPLAYGIQPGQPIRGRLPSGSWRLCAWQAAEQYTPAIASAQLVITVLRPEASVAVAATTDLTQRVAGSLHVSGTSPREASIAVVVLHDAASCPDSPDAATGSTFGARPELVAAGSFDVTAFGMPQVAGTLRACAWVQSRDGATMATTSTLLEVAPATATIELTPLRTSVFDTEHVGIHAVTWSSQSALVAWTGVVAEGDSCAALPATATAGTTSRSTFTDARRLAIGRWRVCVLVGVGPGTPPVATASTIVESRAYEASGTIDSTPLSLVTSWHSGTIAVSGVVNGPSTLHAFLTTGDCAAALTGSSWWYYAGPSVDGSFASSVSYVASRHGTWNVCVIVAATGTRHGILLGSKQVTLRPVTLTWSIAPATTPPIAGRQQPAATVSVTSDGTATFLSGTFPAGTDCSSAQPGWWSYVYTSTTSVTIPDRSTTPGRWRICIRRYDSTSGYGAAMGIDYESITVPWTMTASVDETPITSIGTSYAGRTWVAGTTNEQSVVWAQVTTDSCNLAGYVTGGVFVQGQFGTNLGWTIPQTGPWKVCVLGRRYPGTETVLLGTIDVRVDAPTISWELLRDASQAYVVAGEQVVAARVRGSSNVPISFAYGFIAADAQCASAPLTSLPQQSGSFSIDLTGFDSVTGSRQICVRSWRGSQSLGAKSVSRTILPAVSDLTVTSSGRTVTARGTSPLARRLHVVPVTYASSCTRNLVPPNSTQQAATVDAGAFDVAMRLSRRPASGTTGCLLVRDSTDTRNADAIAFTFG